MFENVDRWTTDGETTDARVIVILIPYLRAYCSGEIKNYFKIDQPRSFLTRRVAMATRNLHGLGILNNYQEGMLIVDGWWMRRPMIIKAHL